MSMETNISKKTKTSDIPVEGMHCASCVSRVQDIFNETEGIEEASVNLATSSAQIKYDPEKLSVEDLNKNINKNAYKLVQKNISLDINDMHCASCVGSVEGSVKNLPGIISVQVNLATEDAFIKFYEGFITENEIAEAIEKSGYSVGLPTDKNTKFAEKDKAYIALKRKFYIALALTIPVTFFEMSLMWEQTPLIHDLPMQIWNYLFFIFTTPVLFWCGSMFFKGFWKQLKIFSADMNSLVAIGTSSAYLYSAIATFYPAFFFEAGVQPHVYYDTAAVIITLILLGRLLEAKAKGKASDAIQKLFKLQPETALIFKDGNESEVRINKIKTGDIVIVKPGERIPLDGLVIKGKSQVDESMISGEPLAVDKNEGDSVTGGTINQSGNLNFKVSKEAGNTILDRIIEMVKEAQSSKGPVQKAVDRVASIFVPIVILIALITLIAWLFIAPAEAKITTALLNFIAVLIIACPCALGLATPTAIMAGTGKGAELGILIKNSESLEKARKINTVVFDKTGTLTLGKPLVGDMIFTSTDDDKNKQNLTMLSAVERLSEHPLAAAIVNYAKEKNINIPDCEDFSSHAGEGVSGTVNEKKVYAGKPEFIRDKAANFEQSMEKAIPLFEKGKTVIFTAIDNEIVIITAITDRLRENSKKAVEDLQKMGLEVWMLTGDNEKTAAAIALQSGIKHFKAGILPAEKANVIKDLQNKGNIVAMTGDGINDAPALAQSDLSLAMASGTDIAIETADITLMNNDPLMVGKAIRLSRKTLSTIWQNLFWAFIYNSIGIPLAAFGILNPMFAAFAMAFSSVSVVSNSLRLKWFK